MKENQSIKVSIIVAIYNSAKFLDKLITSIIDQTYKNIEVILVDDGSPDNSGEICDKYAALDSRIKVLHKKNGGACDARNKGLEMVTGEYLSIIDGDDWLEPDYVEYLLKLAVDTGSDMSMSKYILLHEIGSKLLRIILKLGLLRKLQFRLFILKYLLDHGTNFIKQV